MKLANRSQKVEGSPTLALAAQAMDLKSQGVDVISLSVGEPDWSSFDVCKEAGLKAIEEGKTRYTPASGTTALKEALADSYNKRFKTNFDKSNLIVTPGAKYAIQEALWNLINPGDQVGVLVPFWASYTTMIEIADGKPVLISLNSDFSLDEVALRKACDAGLKLLLINSPNNPSGAILQKEDYTKLQGVMNDFPDLQIILDDIYSELYWGKEAQCPHFLDVAPELADRILMVSGASKAYSMTGWRMGWAVGGKDIVSALSRFQSQTTGCPSSIAQEATLAGVKEAQDQIKKASQTLKTRAQKGYELINALEGVSVAFPEGAFYFWVNLSKVLEKLDMNDKDFCSQFLKEKAVVVVPGTDFGQPGFIRMSFAVSEEVLAEGVKRLSDFIQELKV